jgi:hypothetical protein
MQAQENQQSIHDQLHEVMERINKLEEERQAIYADSRVDTEESPRLAAINHEIAQLWDLRHRLQAALDAGLPEMPIAPPPDASKLTG